MCGIMSYFEPAEHTPQDLTLRDRWRKWPFHALPVNSSIDRFMRSFLIASSFLALLFSNIVSARQDVTFHTMDAKQGLSQSTVQCLFIDTNGFLWLGTQGGLNMWDGYVVTAHCMDIMDTTSMSNDEVSAICEDRHGSIWAGTRDGLNRFDARTGTFRRYSHDYEDTTSLPDSHVDALLTTSKGLLLVGTRRGLAAFEEREDRFSVLPLSPSADTSRVANAVSGLLEDAQGHIWVGTADRRLHELDATGAVMGGFDLPPEPAQGSWAQGLHSFTIFEDTEQRLLAGEGSGGLFLLDRTLGKFVPACPGLNRFLSENGYLSTCMEEDDKGELWLGTFGGGLVRIQRTLVGYETFRAEDGRCGPTSDFYFDLIKDDSGIVFAGSLDRGLISAKTDKISRLVSECGEGRSLSARPVTALFLDDDLSLWVGFMDGLDKVAPSGDVIASLKEVRGRQGQVPLRNLYFIGRDPKGGLLVGGYPLGLIRLDELTGDCHQVLHSNMVGSADYDESGKLWVAGLHDGVFSVAFPDEEIESFRKDEVTGIDLTDHMVFEVLPVSDKELWVGTTDGLFLIDPQQRSGVAYFASEESGLLNHEILCLCHSTRSGIWIGTAGGLHEFDRENNRFTAYTTEDGLPSEIIYSCVEDANGNLWLGTNDGLSRFSLKDRRFRNFGEGDGLASREFNQGPACRGPDGHLFFGTMDGVAIINPDLMTDSRFDPQIHITSVTAVDESRRFAGGRRPTEPLRLHRGQRDISLGFVGLDYRNPRHVRYRYQLEGYDRQWRDAGTIPLTTYTNIPSGSYTFRVRCTNADGVWGDQEASLRLIVLPGLWELWWFRAIVGLVAVGLLSAVVLLRIQRIRFQRDELKREVESQTQELRRLAATDPLTGNANRRFFIEQAQRELALGRRLGCNLCLLMIDIDHFKLINDRFGHAVGDAALKTLTTVAGDSLRETDVLGRLGGDEFAVLLPGTDGEGGCQAAERIREALSHARVACHKDGVTFSISVGVAVQRSEDIGLETLMQRADGALYKAKSSGRDQVVCHSAEEESIG